MMQAQPGTYALIMACDSDQRVEIGKLGLLCVRPGFYVYIGSAFGPGGLKARIGRHANISRRPHWHIDYLRPLLYLRKVCYSYNSEKQEHRWAGALYRFKGASIPLDGFGASDCRCPSHLFRFSQKPTDQLFRHKLNCHLKHYSIQPGLIWPDSATAISKQC
jgi:Uri superfamily endonuclease